MPKETAKSQGLLLFETRLAEALSSSTSPILLYSSNPRALWVRKSRDLELAKPFVADLEASYDGGVWWYTCPAWLYMNGWVYTDPYGSAIEQAMFSMEGKPVGAGTQAKEAKPKVEPPLWEERDV